MHVADYLDEELILPDLKSTSKPEILAELVAPLAEKRDNVGLEEAKKVLLERENLGSTGIGEGVAIPHGKMEDLEDVIMVVGRSKEGMDFASLDKKPCTIFFLVLAPERVAGMHLRILAHVSRLLKDQSFRQAFMEAPDRAALWKLLQSA